MHKRISQLKKLVGSQALGDEAGFKQSKRQLDTIKRIAPASLFIFSVHSDGFTIGTVCEF